MLLLFNRFGARFEPDLPARSRTYVGISSAAPAVSPGCRLQLIRHAGADARLRRSAHCSHVRQRRPSHPRVCAAALAARPSSHTVAAPVSHAGCHSRPATVAGAPGLASSHSQVPCPSRSQSRRATAARLYCLFFVEEASLYCLLGSGAVVDCVVVGLGHGGTLGRG
jgi:hypothetical protein